MARTDRTSRRSFLHATGNTAAVALAASCITSLPALASGGDPLHQLGAEWQAAYAAAQELAKEAFDLQARVAAEHGCALPRVRMGVCRPEPDGPAEPVYVYSENEILKYTDRGSRGIAKGRDAMLAAFRESEAAIERTREALGADTMAEREDAAWNAVDALEEKIMALPAHDAAGVLIKLRVAMKWIGPSNFEGPVSELDYEHRYVLAVAHDLERLAGQSGDRS